MVSDARGLLFSSEKNETGDVSGLAAVTLAASVAKVVAMGVQHFKPCFGGALALNRAGLDVSKCKLCLLSSEEKKEEILHMVEPTS